jgi:exonuclease SbcC
LLICLIDFELLNLVNYIDNVKYIFEDIKNRLKSLKEDLLNLSKKDIDNEKYLSYFEEFLAYLNKLLEFKLNYNNNKDEIKSKFQDFNNKLFNIQADFKEKLKNIDYHIEILKNIINLKDNINKIKEVLNMKLVKLKGIIDNFNFNPNLSITSNFYNIYSNFEDFIIKQDNLVKKISDLKEVNQNLNEFKNNLLNQLEEIEKDLNIKKDNLVSLKSDILNYTEKLDLIFYNLDELKSNYKELEKIQEDYELIEELNNDFSAKSAKSVTDLISFLSTKLFDLLYFSTNKIIENLAEGRYNLFISKGGDIFIRDNWYNVDRGVKSLSGGERFLTSLSLALAISEISSKSKYPIKSLFIDEGFSTLDIDTLNDVMDYLENYFNNVSDKVLGIITHIPEVKDKFNYIIEVIKDKNGSKVNIINKITV